jgi:hypothetical protein
MKTTPILVICVALGGFLSRSSDGAIHPRRAYYTHRAPVQQAASKQPAAQISSPTNQPPVALPPPPPVVPAVPRVVRREPHVDNPTPAPKPHIEGADSPHPEDEDPILAYQKRDAAKGFPEAQFALGMRYLTGNGVEKDESKGMDLIRSAEHNGSLRARDQLLEMRRTEAP